MSFAELLTKSINNKNSLLSVALDPDLGKLPEHVKEASEPFFGFNKAIIDATAEYLCGFKVNSAMYEAAGVDGVAQLKKTCDYVKKNYPEMPVVLDFKRGDVINSNIYYAKYAFEYLKADAITIHPYLGKDANQPFLDYKDKGIIVLCRTSNPGAGEFQDLIFGGKKLYELVAEEVSTRWNENNNCHLVVGATYPQELADIRAIVGDDMFFLAPGLGAQGGDAELSVKAGVNKNGSGLITVSGRGIIYASNGEDFAEAARESVKKLKDDINKVRQYA